LKRSALTSLRTILRSAATALGVERAAHEALIVEMWSEIVGQEAGAHAHPVELRGTTLLVEVEPGLWVQELSARRGQFVEAINRRLEGRVVAEIRIRPGRRSLSAAFVMAPSRSRAGRYSPITCRLASSPITA